ncbi:MAG TPA: hypothetical protein VFE50_03855 [Cyclobacteriaceae bacterium]|nr:hypothetical protein [Cyclobacteriaceae bacterium]
MKTFIKSLSLLLMVVSIVTFQACKEKEDPTPLPVVTAPATVASVQVGTKADITFTFTAEGGYSNATVTATGGTAAVKTAGTAGATTGSVVVEFTADNTAGAGTVVLTLTDGEGQTAPATATVNKTISAPPTIALSAASGNVNPGASVKVTATVTAANGVKNVSYTLTGGLTGSPTSPVTLTGTTVELTFTVPAATAIGATLTAVITATDNQNLNSTPVTFTVIASTNELTGQVTANTTLKKGTPYLIKGTYIVMPGVTLTVEPGAIIKGDKASKGVLVVKQGGKLEAAGTVSDPIVFTSSQPAGERDRGDWGGIIIMGDAYVNQAAKPSVEGLTPPADNADFYKYGTVDGLQATTGVGTNDQNSGTLKYVRIEYAGIELIPNSETNGLTLAGVGSGTTIDYVQSSYGGDDGFEWFGGTVSARHLVSLATWDDDFDTDFGWKGNVQWGLAVRAPFVADQSGSTSFESDSQGNANAIGTVCDGTTGTGCTQGVFSNMTIIGPRDFNNTGSGSTRAISANYTRAMHIRRRTAISILNSVITGYGAASGLQGLQMDDAGTFTNYTNGLGVFRNNILMFPDPANQTATTQVQYGTNVGANATEMANNAFTTVKGFWETGATGTNELIKPASSSAPWAPQTGTPPAGSVNPYTAVGLSADYFFGSKTAGSYPSNPNFAVTSGTLQGLVAADLFADAKISANTFFDKTLTYKGAFGATDWTDTWAEFQPFTKGY